MIKRYVEDTVENALSSIPGALTLKDELELKHSNGGAPSRAMFDSL